MPRRTLFNLVAMAALLCLVMVSGVEAMRISVNVLNIKVEGLKARLEKLTALEQDFNVTIQRLKENRGQAKDNYQWTKWALLADTIAKMGETACEVASVSEVPAAEKWGELCGTLVKGAQTIKAFDECKGGDSMSCVEGTVGIADTAGVDVLEAQLSSATVKKDEGAIKELSCRLAAKQRTLGNEALRQKYEAACGVMGAGLKYDENARITGEVQLEESAQLRRMDRQLEAMDAKRRQVSAEIAYVKAAMRGIPWSNKKGEKKRDPCQTDPVVNPELAADPGRGTIPCKAKEELDEDPELKRLAEQAEKEMDLLASQPDQAAGLSSYGTGEGRSGSDLLKGLRSGLSSLRQTREQLGPPSSASPKSSSDRYTGCMALLGPQGMNAPTMHYECTDTHTGKRVKVGAGEAIMKSDMVK